MLDNSKVHVEIVDLFCGAGGAAMGYHRALEAAGISHHITGVDIKPQPNYPFTFAQGDALSYPLDGVDFVHASPPCQYYTVGAKHIDHSQYQDLLGPTRVHLQQYGAFYVIENVKGAPIYQTQAITLCGSMFDLRVLRHRWFEFPYKPVPVPEPRCNHVGRVKGEKYYVTVAGHGGNGSHRYDVWARAMGIDWMTKYELTQAIPPAYTQYIMSHMISNNTLGGC